MAFPESISPDTSRRRFIGLTLAAGVAPYISRGADKGLILGQGDHRYRLVEGWGVLGADTPVGNCHGIVVTKEGHIILLTDQTKNNFIVYDQAGKLLHKWGTSYPGAHGLSLVEEKGKEVLYFTDTKLGKVFKASLNGELLGEWGWPEASGKYAKAEDYKPSWTLHRPDGGFYVLDGYGKDYIPHYDAEGKLKETLGGAEGGIVHWGPHGGMWDGGADGSLLIAMSDQQHLLRLSPQGKSLAIIPLPGGNPRQIRKAGDHYYVAHLADNWPADRNSRGFVSILDKDLKVISNLAGTPAEYDDEGALHYMKSTDPVFTHPHDLAVDAQGSIYVAQFMSGNTYPLKLERV